MKFITNRRKNSACYNKVVTDNFKNHLLIGIIVVFGSFGAFGFVIYSLSQKLGSASEKISAERLLIRKNQDLVESLASLRQSSGEIEGYITKIEGLLPEKDGLIDFPKQVENLARITQVSSVFNFQGEPIKPEGMVGFWTFTLSLTGDYVNIMNFVKEMEITPGGKFVVGIDSLKVQEFENSYKADIKGRVFFK